MEREKIREIIAKMTLEEKASFCSGSDFWHTESLERLGIPASMVADGPHGLRKQIQEGDHLGVNDSITAVCFPAGCAMAAGFDTETVPEDIRRSFLREVGATSVESFYADVGLGRHVAEAVANRLSAMMHFTDPKERKTPGMAPVEVRGNEGMALSLAACCHPIPGDEILGFIRPGKGLYIHRKDCEHAREGMVSDPGRWMAAHWSDSLADSARFSVPLEITAKNERAAVAACVALVAREQGAITGLSVDPAKDGVLLFHLMLQVHDRMHLSRIVRSLSHDENVLSISRRLSELVRTNQDAQVKRDEAPENRFNSEDLFAAADSRHGAEPKRAA